MHKDGPGSRRSGSDSQYQPHRPSKLGARQIRAHFPLRTWEVCCQLLGTRIHLPVECGTRMFVFLVRKRNASILFAVPAGQVSVTFGVRDKAQAELNDNGSWLTLVIFIAFGHTRAVFRSTWQGCAQIVADMTASNFAMPPASNLQYLRPRVQPAPVKPQAHWLCDVPVNWDVPNWSPSELSKRQVFSQKFRHISQSVLDADSKRPTLPGGHERFPMVDCREIFRMLPSLFSLQNPVLHVGAEGHIPAGGRGKEAARSADTTRLASGCWEGESDRMSLSGGNSPSTLAVPVWDKDSRLAAKECAAAKEGSADHQSVKSETAATNV
ncbi:unnamed protein product [Symbiodinium sp. KB8]|nr:unnamed protein product [Symbiodinium sp. KB8]